MPSTLRSFYSPMAVTTARILGGTEPEATDKLRGRIETGALPGWDSTPHRHRCQRAQRRPRYEPRRRASAPFCRRTLRGAGDRAVDPDVAGLSRHRRRGHAARRIPSELRPLRRGPHHRPGGPSRCSPMDISTTGPAWTRASRATARTTRVPPTVASFFRSSAGHSTPSPAPRAATRPPRRGTARLATARASTGTRAPRAETDPGGPAQRSTRPLSR